MDVAILKVIMKPKNPKKTGMTSKYTITTSL